MAHEKRHAPRESEGVFPWSLAEQVFKLINAHGIRTLRYADLEASVLRNPSRFRYIDEYVRFGGSEFTPLATIRALSRLLYLRLGDGLPFYESVADRLTCGSDAPTIILQHDADLLPERSVQMMALEELHGLRSSNYFFAEHAETDEYDLDIEALKPYEAKDFEIGYHQNAYERSGYEVEKALDLVEEDLAFLGSHFNIRTFVPHGGRPSADGLNNRHLPHEGRSAKLLWAYNGRCILKEYTWTDGGIHKSTKTDPREFVRGLKNGTRAVMLMHPQYYADVLRDDWEDLPISAETWWRELWGL